jgi:hypothetical protein
MNGFGPQKEKFMRKTMFALAAAVALGAATMTTGAMTTPAMAFGGHGGHGGGHWGGGGGWHGGGWHGGGWRGGGYWGPGVALGLGLGGLYAYGGYPYGYCGGYPYAYGYYNNCGPYYYGW